GAIKFHPWKIYEWKTLLEQQNQSWKTFFQDGEILPYSLTYESLVNNFLQEVSQVLQHICLTPKMNPNSLAMPVQRQANAANARLISAYNRLPTPFSASLLRLYRWRRPLNDTVLPLPGQKGAKKKGGLA
ncbi:MAG: Stf0 family sulfotransferase, partial [Cyanobacteria bacterium P01_F01_bin.3]